MNAGDARVCPSCGARNKPKWEFCVRCGESLQGVPLGEDRPEAAPEEGEVPGGGGFSWVGLGFGAVLLLGVALFLPSMRPATTTPDPNTWAFPRPVPTAAPPEEVSPPSGQRELNVGLGMLSRDNYASAVGVLGQAVAAAPEDASAHYAYAQALWQTGAQQEALAEYREAARLQPGNADYRRDLARALVATGQREAAIGEYEAALELRPDSPGWLRNLADLRVQAGQYPEAIGLLTQATELRPDDPALREQLALTLERSGNAAAAEEAYRNALAADPAFASSRALLAHLMARQGKGEEAIRLVREGIALDPKAAGLQRDLGSLLERSGRIADAVAAYRQYARLAPQAPDAQAIARRAQMLERREAARSS